VDGENIQSAKQDIKRILDTLIADLNSSWTNLFMSDKRISLPTSMFWKT
jgi:hypothetical protein